MSSIPFPDLSGNSTMDGPALFLTVPGTTTAAMTEYSYAEGESSGPLGASPLEAPLCVKHMTGCLEIAPADLRTEQGIRSWRDTLLTLENLEIYLENLPAWEPDVCWSILLFLGQLADSCHFYLAEGGKVYDDLLDAVLAFFEEEQRIEQRERVRQAAVEVAAIKYPRALPVACDQIAKRLKIPGYTAVKLEKEAKICITATQANNQDLHSEDDALIYISEVLSSAPVLSDAIVPAPWQMTDGGIFQRRENETELILSSPLVITRRLSHVENNHESLEIAWFRDNAWQTQIVARSTLFTSRSIVELADYGLPVNSNNAASIVEYLADYEAINLERLPRSLVNQQLGWIGEEGFLWGTKFLTQPRTSAEATKEAEVRVTAHEVTFRGADDGDDQIAAGFRAAGSREGWQAAVKPLAEFPRLKLAVYAALSPPLLALLDASNFMVSFAGATSQGKTTALRIAASCWGCPDERSPRAAIGTWDSTRIWIERAAAVENDLPLILDDTKRARRSEDIAQTIYDVTSGRSRGRGSLQGTRSAQTFRTVMLTSGEAPITSFSQDGGTRARVLEVWGSPFGRADAKTAALVNAVNQGILENFGQVGPQWIEFLLSVRDHWTAVRETYEENRRQRQAVAARARQFGELARLPRVVGFAARRPLVIRKPSDFL